MKICFVLFTLLLIGSSLTAQDSANHKISSKQFFTDERPLYATLVTDLGVLVNNGTKGTGLKATFTCKFPDSLTIKQEIMITTRGKFRLKNCEIPPLKLDFKSDQPSGLSQLKSLKLTNGCKAGSYNDQLLLKEYMAYKIYNFLSEKSLRVRLVRLRFEDSKGKKKPFDVYSFFTEDIDEMAKRNDCRELKDTEKLNAGTTNRAQLTLVCIFEYMIGNTDWSLPGGHNIKHIRSKKDSTARPYAVPYDFDHSGLVNANYARPNEQLGTQSVTERVYRGYARTIDELNTAMEIFKTQKENIYTIIKSFEPLSPRSKEQMIKYLDEFYESVKTETRIRREFIDNARVD